MHGSGKPFVRCQRQVKLSPQQARQVETWEGRAEGGTKFLPLTNGLSGFYTGCIRDITAGSRKAGIGPPGACFDGIGLNGRQTETRPR